MAGIGGHRDIKIELSSPIARIPLTSYRNAFGAETIRLVLKPSPN